MNWSEIDLERLVDELHASNEPADAERIARAFEEVLRLVRNDPELLPSLLAAAVSLAAYEEGISPRTVLEQWFRRSVPDEVWRERYLPLFG
jgi:Ser/Thr protein kinase RdoA (MazF antagonist)